jgi:hypothetical protein
VAADNAGERWNPLPQIFNCSIIAGYAHCPPIPE